MASGHRWNKAGDDFVEMVTAEYRSGGTLHWPTAIAACAFASGQMALMARESSFTEGGIVDSARVASLIHDGDVPTRTIWGYSVEIAKQAFGLDPDTLPAYRATVLGVGTRLIAGTWPTLEIPLPLVPHETPVNAGPRLRRAIHGIAEPHGLHGDDIAFALATATMKMIGSVQHLGVRDITALALQCCVAGSRFAPVADRIADPAIDFVPGAGTGTGKDDEPCLKAGTVTKAMAGIAQDGFGRRR